MRAAAMPVMVSPVPPMGSRTSRDGIAHLSQNVPPAGDIINLTFDQKILGRIIERVSPVNQIRYLIIYHGE